MESPGNVLWSASAAPMTGEELLEDQRCDVCVVGAGIVGMTTAYLCAREGRKVIVLDHRDCGAYREFLGEDFGKAPARETEAHAAKLHLLRDQLRAKHPELAVEMLLMSLDGKVEAVP